MDKISIVIPLYNKENSIIRTVNSILNQSYHNYEIVIINDGSTDNSLEKVISLQDKRIIVYNQSNLGVSSARNKGIEMASGQFLMFLDADDFLNKDALLTFVKLIEMYPECTFYAANFSVNYRNITKDFNTLHDGIIVDLYRELCLKTFFCRIGSFVIRSDYCKKNLSFNTLYSHFEDLDFIFKTFDKIHQFAYTSTSVMSYDRSYSSLSNFPRNKNKSFVSSINLNDNEYIFKRKYCAKLYFGVLFELVKRRRFKDFISMINRNILYIYLPFSSL